MPLPIPTSSGRWPGLAVTALTALALVGLGAASGVSARPALGVVVPGARLAHALHQVWGEQTGSGLPPINVSTWDASMSGLATREAGGNLQSLLLMPQAVALTACRDGLLQPADWTGITGAAAEGGCSLPGFEETLVLAWDESRDPAAPGWPDFWDVARFPGKRGLPRQARGTLEVALLADGVGIGDVYRVLGSGSGVTRAFRKLDQIRPYMVWWTDGEAARRALTSGAVMMTLAPAAFDAPKPAKAGPIVAQQWTQCLTQLQSWALPKGASGSLREAALAFLRIEQEPLFQAAVTRLTPVVGASAEATKVLSPELLAQTAAAPGRPESTLPINDAFWSGHADLVTRFDAWLASPHR